MNELKIFRDRCQGRSAIIHISAANLKSSGENTSLEFPLGDDQDFAIFFDIEKILVDEGLLESARRLILNIDHLDNQVQEQCALECTRSGLHPRNYEGVLAFITLSHGTARLRYFGIGVNTEWDEIVKECDGVWKYVGPSEADISPRNA